MRKFNISKPKESKNNICIRNDERELDLGQE